MVVGIVNSVAAYFWIVATAQERVHLKAAAALPLCFIVMTPRTVPYGRYFGFRSSGSVADALRRLPPDEDNQELSGIGYAAFVFSVIAAAAFCLSVLPNSLAAVLRGVGAIIVVSLVLLAVRAWFGYHMRARNSRQG